MSVAKTAPSTQKSRPRTSRPARDERSRAPSSRFCPDPVPASSGMSPPGETVERPSRPGPRGQRRAGSVPGRPRPAARWPRRAAARRDHPGTAASATPDLVRLTTSTPAPGPEPTGDRPGALGEHGVVQDDHPVAGLVGQHVAGDETAWCFPVADQCRISALWPGSMPASARRAAVRGVAHSATASPTRCLVPRDRTPMRRSASARVGACERVGDAAAARRAGGRSGAARSQLGAYGRSPWSAGCSGVATAAGLERRRAGRGRRPVLAAGVGTRPPGCAAWWSCPRRSVPGTYHLTAHARRDSGWPCGGEAFGGSGLDHPTASRPLLIAAAAPDGARQKRGRTTSHAGTARGRRGC